MKRAVGLVVTYNRMGSGIRMIVEQKKIGRVMALISFLFMVLCPVYHCVLSGEMMPPEDRVIPMAGMIIINSAAAICFLYLFIFSPLNYVVYAILYQLYGMVIFIDGGNTIGFLLFLLSWCFFYKSGFFRTRGKLKGFIMALILLIPIGIQYQWGAEYTFVTLCNILAVLLIFFTALLLFLPDIRHSRQAQTLRLSPDQFTQRDAQFLRKVLAGEKYEAIAAEYGIAASTLKNRLGILFKRLEVHDRVTFLAHYAQAAILVEPPR
jgi:DNA-binding CsgD family transcriptional regulator